MIVVSYSRTASGFFTGNGWFRILEVHATEVALGEAVLAALLETKHSVPDPPPDASRSDPVLEALGLKRESEYMNQTLSVSIRLDTDDALFEVTPQSNRGRHGFVPIREKTLVLSADAITPESVGAAVRRAFAEASIE